LDFTFCALLDFETGAFLMFSVKELFSLGIGVAQIKTAINSFRAPLSVRKA